MRLELNPVESSEGREESNRRVVTTHEEVLAIVHNRTRGRIMKRTCPAAEMRLLFEQMHSLASFSQRHTRREACETATDDEDVKRHFGF